jgi:hypothetical protein
MLKTMRFSGFYLTHSRHFRNKMAFALTITLLVISNLDLEFRGSPHTKPLIFATDVSVNILEE